MKIKINVFNLNSMELDFSTIKALSSPTRVRILSQVIEAESTPTRLSDNLGKSKSTVAAHLQQLTEAGLLEKDEEEGRRRVVYRPTGKAKAIVEGRERKVKFSLASSGLSALAGLGLLAGQLISWTQSYTLDSQEQLSGMTAEAPGAMAEAGATSQGLTTGDFVLFAGVTLLFISVGTFLYGLLMKKLGSATTY